MRKLAMTLPRSLLLLTVVVTSAAQATAADLTKIDRTIAKEPTYKGHSKYCLLVFGPEAKTKVWIVLDGEVLYVDHNATGDFTEPYKRLPCKGKLTVPVTIATSAKDQANYTIKNL